MKRRTKKKWNGPLQYEDPSKQLMMLPSDMARLRTLALRARSSIYAHGYTASSASHAVLLSD